jgi:hypothetical protein
MNYEPRNHYKGFSEVNVDFGLYMQPHWLMLTV